MVVARLGKSHEDYWKRRLRKRSYRGVDGLRHEVADWQVTLGHNGRHRWINLGTPNKDEAAKKARDTWLKLKTQGWDAVKPSHEKIVNPNVGDFLAAVRADGGLSAGTFEIYAKKFRRLVAGVFGIKSTPQKHDYAGGGYAKWLARVHAVRFSRLSVDAVRRWQTRYINAAGKTPVAERKARRTVASVLRSSKALFAPRIIERLHLELPDPLPLAGVQIPRVSVGQYVSRINPEVLFQQAERELERPSDEVLQAAIVEKLDALERARRSRRAASSRDGKKLRNWTATEKVVARWSTDGVERERADRRQMFRALCLALFAGLRRDEIDTLTWKQIDFAQRLILVETNEFTRAKSEGSETGVDIDPTFCELLREWMKSSSSRFVIERDAEPRPTVSTYHHYRCATVFKKLAAWLRVHGVEDRNALHTLRKEFGTQINRTHGLFAASASLRHSSVQLTRSVYVAKKDRAVFAVPGRDANPAGADASRDTKSSA